MMLQRYHYPTEGGGFVGNKEDRVKQVEAGLLAAVRITDSNLINMQKRIRSKGSTIKQDSATRLILQSEALSIFKGNMVKILKQIYHSSDLNRIKRTISFMLTLDTIHPIIVNVKVSWLNNMVSYVPDHLYSMQSEITKAFCYTTLPEIERQGLDAMKETHLEERENYLLPVINNTLADINFDSIKQIKFTK